VRYKNLGLLPVGGEIHESRHFGKGYVSWEKWTSGFQCILSLCVGVIRTPKHIDKFYRPFMRSREQYLQCNVLNKKLHDATKGKIIFFRGDHIEGILKQEQRICGKLFLLFIKIKPQIPSRMLEMYVISSKPHPE
jgi:hypothetical protein